MARLADAVPKSLLYLTVAIAVGGLSILLLAAWNLTLRKSWSARPPS
jgi:hypothetical protein